MIYSVLLAAVACVLACYFAAAHTVLKTFSRKRLVDLVEQRGQPERGTYVTRHLSDLLLMTGLVRACLGLVVVLATVYAVEYQLGQAHLPGTPAAILPFIIAFSISAGLLSIFTVAIPVSWAEHRGERLLAWSTPILRVTLLLSTPLTKALSLFDPVVRRLSGVDLRDDDADLSDQVLAAVEDHEEGAAVADEQKQMIEAVFDLDHTDAGEIMTPRTEIQGIELPATLDEVKTAVLEHGHSRLPVYRDNLDRIAGILYAKDLLQLLDDPEREAVANPSEPFDLEALLREPFVVPESKTVLELLHEFRATKIHLAIVVDEYGGTAGLVTIEDILEEIVGDIQDEYEPEDDAPEVTAVDETTVRVDARLRIDDLNDQFDVDLPEDEDYDTVGGFVFATLGHIPDEGETFEASGVKVTVDETERTRVVAVTVEKLDLTTENSVV
ncbi:MAG: hemolysin family protein [Planctomycetota bacterium]